MKRVTKALVIIAVDAILWVGLFVTWLSAIACVSVHSRPVTGAIGRAAVLPTTVACAASLSDNDCEQVHDACSYINGAFGTELLLWTQNSVADIMVSAKPGLPAFGGLQEGMHTAYRVYLGSGYFHDRALEVTTTADCCTTATRQTLFRHELLHALGLPHNDWDPESLMSPAVAYNETEPRVMSAGDIAMLRAIYERTFGL